MGFEVAADAYQRFMGRYADPLAVETARLVRVHPGERAVDVGAGTGALTEVLAGLLGEDAVIAVEPSAPFVAALRSRLPAVEVHHGVAERLPLDDASVDLAVAQLVVHFMSDPARGAAELHRVLRPGGAVAVSVWDFAGGRAPLSLFWRAARELDPGVDDESERMGAADGQLTALLAGARFDDVTQHELTVRLPYRDADEWWQPYELGVGPAGAYVAGLEPEHRAAVRARARELLGDGAGEVAATAWVATGIR